MWPALSSRKTLPATRRPFCPLPISTPPSSPEGNSLLLLTAHICLTIFKLYINGITEYKTMLKNKIIKFNLNKKKHFKMCLSTSSVWGRVRRRSTEGWLLSPLWVCQGCYCGDLLVSVGDYAIQATKFFELVDESSLYLFSLTRQNAEAPFGFSMWIIKPGRFLSSQVLSLTKWAIKS